MPCRGHHLQPAPHDPAHERLRLGHRRDHVLGPADDQRRHADLAQHGCRVRACGQAGQGVGDPAGRVGRDRLAQPRQELGTLLVRGLAHQLGEHGVGDGRRSFLARDRGLRGARRPRGVAVRARARVRQHQALQAVRVPAHEGEGRIAAHGEAAHHGPRHADVVQQGHRVVRDPLHGQEAVSRRRPAEAAGVEADDLVRGGEHAGLGLPHREAEGEGVQQEERGPLAADVVREVRAPDPRDGAHGPSLTRRTPHVRRARPPRGRGGPGPCT